MEIFKRGKIIILLILVVCCGVFLAVWKKVPINEIPMYGNIPPTPEVQKANERFFKEIESLGTREEGAKKMIDLALIEYAKGDFKTAMKRYNQAWLLDPNNSQVFLGFGELMDRQGNNDKAIDYYKKSLELDPKNAIAMCQLATTSAKKALENKSKQDFDQALILYEKAIDLAAESDYSGEIGKIYEQWAMALFMNKNYADAWKKVKLSRQHGNKINQEFIKDLSRAMPESKE